ncbi:MAG: hypothetical protein ACRD0X_04440 [Thermoanaerobaculia bacterium]
MLRARRPVNYGLFPALPTPARRSDRRAAHATRAAADLAAWVTAHGVETAARLAVPA